MGNDTLGTNNASAMIKIGIVSSQPDHNAYSRSPADPRQAIGPEVWFNQ